jgi:pimeloyl-ACP methyl ester carboxylesterase
MRDHPEGIRSVVLDSAYPPNVEGIAEAPMHFQRAFDQLFSECRADEACNAAYPNLETDFYTLIEDLNKTPYTLAEELELSASDYVDSLFQALYDTWLIPGLPYAIFLATQGNLDDSYALLTGELKAEDIAADEQPLSVLWQLLVGVFARQAASIDDDAEGMYNSVECYEDAPFQTAQMIRELSQGVHPSMREAQIDSALSQLELCELWSGETAGEIENEAVVSAIPTLVLAGSLDPITPPSWGELAAQSLANSSFVLFPGMGHSLIDHYECPDSLIASFFDKPGQALDLSCVTQMKPSFFVPE